MAGTECASDFIFNDSSFRPFARQAMQRDGSLSHFEVLLETSSLGGNAPQSTIVASRVLAQ